MLQSTSTTAAVLLDLSRKARTPIRRTMRQFAEDEFIIPDGDYAGYAFRADRQPYAGLLLDAVDSGLYSTVVCLGPVQSGKTMMAFILPVLYHLFEIGETVICGVPNLDTARDKWQEDLQPAILASRYAEFLPKSGGSAKGGTPTAIHFRNGVTLRFMAAGGGTAQVASYTARVVAVTEADKIDKAAGGSMESTKMNLLRARTEAFGSRGLSYEECTVTTSQGHVWRNWDLGTKSRIVRPCPYCGAWVTPEREHFRGWQGAQSLTEARAKGHWVCPACEHRWEDGERKLANLQSKLLHVGQEIEPDGTIIGEHPPTTILGFRWSAIDNHFNDPPKLAQKEWLAARQHDEDAAEQDIRQNIFAVPWDPPTVDLTSLTADSVQRRQGRLPRGLVPADTTHLAVAMDLGKWLGHWVLLAGRADGRLHIPDYGLVEFDADNLGVERGTLAGLREFRDTCETGWALEGGGTMSPAMRLFDSGWAESRPALFAFCRESGNGHLPVKGFGSGQDFGKDSRYRSPRKLENVVVNIGTDYHVVRDAPEQWFRCDANADHWKSYLHKRLKTPPDAAGSLSLFHAAPHEHTKIAKHFTAEKQVNEYDSKAGRDLVRWFRTSRNNHFLDAGWMACVALHMLGWEFVIPPEKVVERDAPRPIERDDYSYAGDTPYLITER